MKEFAVITAFITISVLVILVFLQTVPGLGSGDKLPVKVSGPESKSVAPAPVYNASGKILDRNPNESDDAVSGAESRKIAPVFDTNGESVSDPSGTIWNANP